MMKVGVKLFLWVGLLSMLQISNHAHAVERWTCNSGLIPKFENNRANYYIEPALWDDAGIRNEIIRAFQEWNRATGWKMKFTLERGRNSGTFGDRLFHVRSAWLGSGTNGRNTAIPKADRGQCHWYDNDIVISKSFLWKIKHAGSGQRSLYRLMLHEIGHAVGMQHNNDLSVVNRGIAGVSGLQHAYFDGLFGWDILFIRELYGYSGSNLKNNLRADAIVNESGFLRSFLIVDHLPDGSTRAPYTITNESQWGVQTKIEFIVATDGRLYGNNVHVVKKVFIYIGDGVTQSDYASFHIAPELMRSGRSVLGFRIANDDANKWDDAVMLGLL